MRGSLLTSEILNLSPKIYFLCVSKCGMALSQYVESCVKVVYDVMSLSGFCTVLNHCREISTYAALKIDGGMSVLVFRSLSRNTGWQYVNYVYIGIYIYRY
jgi:hypothetical protein